MDFINQIEIAFGPFDEMAKYMVRSDDYILNRPIKYQDALGIMLSQKGSINLEETTTTHLGRWSYYHLHSPSEKLRNGCMEAITRYRGWLMKNYPEDIPTLKTSTHE